jgi:hypothetical protein
MKPIRLVAACAATMFACGALAQTATTPRSTDAPNQSAPAIQSAPKPGDSSSKPARQAQAPAAGSDPSSTRGRPDARYPRPSGQDARTDAAATPHSENGHDHAADSNPVSPSDPSVANQSQKSSAYGGATGKKAKTPDCKDDPAAGAARSTSASPDSKAAQGCAESKRKPATATEVPPGATGTMPR